MSDEFPDAPPAADDADEGIAAPVVTDPPTQSTSEAPATTVADDDGWEDPDPALSSENNEAAASQDEPPTATDPEPDDVERRPRGWLESDIEKLLTRIESGEVATDDGQKLTPHFLAKKLAEIEGLPKEPSTGAVSAVLDRWVKIGAAITSDHPYAFVAFTDEATAAGIAALKANVKAEKQAAKQAESDAAKQAALDAQAAAAPAEEDAPVPG